ncbi:MAG: DNA repair protein RecN [Gemmatimonadota bacterium]
MLCRLRIGNFALIESADIEFGAGLNVITGETGAGKSILLGALYSILGGAVSADLVRSGSDSGAVEGLFELDPDGPAAAALRDLEVEADEGQLVLRRELRAEGRSRAFVNDRLVPVRRLREVGACLVDLHGQHEHQSLLNASAQRRFLDESGGLARHAEAVAAACRAWRAAAAEEATLRAEQRSLQEAEELRRYQLEEIVRLAPQPGEDEDLERQVRVLENQTELVKSTQQLYEALYGGEEATVAQLGRARRELERLAGLDPALTERAAAVSELLYRVEDLAEGLRAYAGDAEADPGRLEEMHLRLEDLRRLRHKHGGTLEGVLERRRELEAQEERSDDLDRAVERAAERVRQCLASYDAACRALSLGRREAAARLSVQVAEGLRSLGMADAAFQVDLDRAEEAAGPVEEEGRRYRADERGLESVTFRICANRGERVLPLASVASGGEISRIMLVLKSLIAARDAVGTLVFDEIDVGISGRIAAAVGRQLAALSGSHQTIAITHLPQIASLADHHFAVRKRLEGGRTVTEVRRLSAGERAEEIAQLLAGETVSATARRHAREMLK